MKRILVTGGAGFLGSNLCKRLIKEGNHVICVDNLYTGRMVNIEELMDNPEFEFINHNIIEPLDIHNLDEIYNLACPASPPHYQKSPTYTTKTCVLGILNMLELATKNNAKIMQFSTSEVYGDPFVHPEEMLIQSVSVHVMMKERELRKHSVSIITGNSEQESRL